jgi:hypothetical protein
MQKNSVKSRERTHAKRAAKMKRATALRTLRQLSEV